MTVPTQELARQNSVAYLGFESVGAGSSVYLYRIQKVIFIGHVTFCLIGMHG